MSAEEWSYDYTLTGKPELVLDTNDGDVEVVTGSSQQIHIHVVTHGYKKDDLHINGKQSGNRVEFTVHRSNHVCFGFCFNSVRVEVHVPSESDLNIHTGDGGVHVESVHGNLTLQTNDGDVKVRDAEGVIHADTHDGRIDVTGRFDLVNLRSGDGDVDAELNVSGNPQPGWVLRSGDGNVRLRLPENIKADLIARTGDGNVKVDLPLTTTDSKQENAVRGKINGGGVTIELQTGDGDIRVGSL